MKPTLQLSISQQLTLTPQLQQAIRLLQLSTLDLQQEIQQAVESNPMLEATPQEPKEEALENTRPSDEPADFQWSELYSGSGKRSNFEEPDFNYDNLYCTTTNLQDHLHWQLGLTPMSDVDRAIATAIIDATNDDGFLTVPLDELHSSLDSETHPIDLDEIEVVRHRLQQFDPVGCACASLAETLLVQLRQLTTGEEQSIELARQILDSDIELLAQHNYRQLMKNYQVNETRLDKALQIIQGLNPKPGSLIHQTVTEYIIPDIIVKKINGIWQANLNNNVLPKLSINHHYASLVQRADNSADNQFLKNNLQEARWFLKSIQSRQETLLKVARCIVDYQQDFLEYGEEAMKPLILNNIALALDLHESTISRVTTQKFMHTPRGVFELKYFFSSHVATASGGECSSTAIRAVIKKLIAAENRKKPLSDSKIALLIGEQGIRVARRTVAKYREAMGIAPSNERKTIGS
ncbi:RNA polymerase factor sigma-54 [Legionella spiritensis]|uniref:RNA polymerase factor sigma-54 n=1 Tax=Legionella spiritensis TaxID=452 RepID=UPI000F6CF220|nr:RNA polymerase factor sigma-54 [Legionella spiritensis]VEG92198.1 RNA polymerase sigma-54 factor (sigma-L) [Legionella spiritensis]